MTRPIPEPSWSDEQLAEAIKASTNWRAVMRELGLIATSASAIRIVRRRADELALDTSHFRGKRRWSDTQLRNAIASAGTWDEVLAQLGWSTNSGNGRAFIKSHAIRLGLDYSRLGARTPVYPEPSDLRSELQHVREAGASIAATWFTLCGCAAAFPIEPAVFDLLIATADGIKRIQVKTTTAKSQYGWHASVSRRPHTGKNLRRHTPYDPDDIDFFFIIDGDLTMYLIPSWAVAGQVSTLMRTYKDYIVGNVQGLMSSAA